MTSLVRVELRRLLSRRMVWVVAIGAVGLLVTGGIIAFVQAGNDARDYANSRSNREGAFVEREIRRCAREDFGPNPQIPRSQRLAECEARFSGGFDNRFHYSSLRDVLLGSTPPFLLLGLLLGASFIGAEWHFGTIATTLTWEPRRMRVLAAKAFVVAIFGALFFIMLQVFLAAVLFPAAAVHGTTAGIDAAWIKDVGGVVIRGAVLAAITALIGFSFASIGRNTAAAMGAVFVYFVAIEPLVRGFRPRWVGWLYVDNAALFISEQSTSFPPLDRSAWGAGLLLAIYAGIALAAGLLWFRRRDVT